ncbi:MAG TPA: hypothetical protein PLD82_09195, partial [Spirochaetota bacterium]|nr:hypothetical protein [Spirochaetota bacterium]
MRRILTILAIGLVLPATGLSAGMLTGVSAGGSWALAPGLAGSLDGAGRVTLFTDFREPHWPASLGLALGYAPYTLSGVTGFSYRLTSLLARSWWAPPLGLPTGLMLEAGLMAGAGFERLGDEERGSYGRSLLLGSGLRARIDLGGLETGLELDW